MLTWRIARHLYRGHLPLASLPFPRVPYPAGDAIAKAAAANQHLRSRMREDAFSIFTTASSKCESRGQPDRVEAAENIKRADIQYSRKFCTSQ
jgi:hypothetical protein